MQLELPGVGVAEGLRQCLSWMFETLECGTETRRMHADHGRYLVAFFGDVSAKAIGYVQLREYYLSEKARGISKETIRKRLSTMRMALREAVAHGVISRIPDWPVIRTDTRAKEGFWTLTQWESVHLACDDVEFRTWVANGWWLGMRTSDNNRFRWQDVDLAKGTWVRRSSKTKIKPATLPLPKRLLAILKERYEEVRPHPRDLVAGHSMGYPNREIKELARRAGVPVISPTEAARHSCETFLEESGATKTYQMTWLGLTSERMLRHYRHVTDPTIQHGIAAVDRASEAVR